MPLQDVLRIRTGCQQTPAPSTFSSAPEVLGVFLGGGRLPGHGQGMKARITLASLLLPALPVLWGCMPPAAPRALYALPDERALPPPRVTIRGSLIELNQAIYFEFNSDRLLPISSPILDEVARLLREHRELWRVRIEGHTDNVGTPTYNLMLSQRRAQAVASYLQRRGVAAPRLIAAGLGPSQPVADNTSEEGRARNRRVRFVILDQGDAAPAPGGVRSASLGRGVQ